MKHIILVLSFLTLLLFPSYTFAAIAFDAVSTLKTGNDIQTTAQTVAHTAVAESIVIVVITSNQYDTSDAINTVTYDGAAMTQQAFSVDGVGYATYIFYILAPTTGSSVNCVVTGTVKLYSAEISVLSYTGANSSSQPDSTGTATDASAEATEAVATTVVESDTWLVGGWKLQQDGAPSGDVVFDNTVNNGTNRGLTTRSSAAGDSAGTVATGAQSLQWTVTTGYTGAGAVVSLKAAAAPSDTYQERQNIIWDEARHIKHEDIFVV